MSKPKQSLYKHRRTRSGLVCIKQDLNQSGNVMWRKGKARVLIKIWLRGGLHSPKECVVIGEVGPGGGMMPQIAQVQKN